MGEIGIQTLLALIYGSILFGWLTIIIAMLLVKDRRREI